MEAILQLPDPEDPVDHRVDQGVGTYSDYYPGPNPLPAPVERLTPHGRKKKPRGRRYDRPFGEPTEAESLYPAPKHVYLTPEQREVNSRGAALARQALEAARARRESSDAATTDTGGQTPEKLLEAVRASWEPQQGELF